MPERLLVFARAERVLALKMIAELVGGEGRAADFALVLAGDLFVLVFTRTILSTTFIKSGNTNEAIYSTW